MPYTIKKKKSEYCVHKADKDGEPIGESLGCHSSRKKAGAQIAAIEASEEENMSKKSVQKAELNGQESAEDRRMMIENAWYEFRNGNWNSHVVECYDEYIVVWDGDQKTHFQVGCTMSEDGVEFAPMNEWVEVKLKSEWVAKSIELLGIGDLVVIRQPEEAYSIKSLGEYRIGGYGILWGDESRKDLHGEFFTPDTRDIKAIFDVMGAVPNVVHHGVDDEVKKFVLGPVDVMEPDSKGLWWEAKIKEHKTYREMVEPLLENQVLFSSSGVLPGAKRVNKETGEITRWPIVEMTDTWIPAEHRMLNQPITEIKSLYQTIGLDFDEEVINVDPKEAVAVAKGVEKARLDALIQQEILNLALAELL